MEIKSCGYAVRSFHDADPAQRHLVLRHDIDQCIAIARRLADAEAAEGWRSAWFVLVRTEMYNPFSRANTGHLRAMISAGHEIGLHLESTHHALAREVGGILLLGDAIIGHPPGALGLIPEHKLDNRAQLQRSLCKLLDYDFEVLLLCDGHPVLTGGKEKVAEFLSRLG